MTKLEHGLQNYKRSLTREQLHTMRFLVLCVFVGFMACLTRAQGQSEPIDETDTHYLLIDQSLSMKDHFDELVTDVESAQNGLLSAEPSSWLRVAYFGVDTSSQCKRMVEFSDRLPITDKVEIANLDYTELTPLGFALRSALIETLGEDSKIFVFSDQEQSEECEPSLCSVFNGLPASTKSRIHFIPVGMNPEGEQKVDCLIDPIRLAPLPLIDLDLRVSFETERGTSSMKGWDDYSWAKVPFFGLLFFFLSSAFLFQFHYGAEAGKLESQTKNISRKKLLNPNYDASTIVKSSNESEFPKPRWAQRLTTAGVILLVALVFTWRSFPFVGEYFHEARSVTWIVVASEFATAFAILAIAPIFFASRQFWRFVQARQNLDVVSGQFELERMRLFEEQRLEALRVLGEKQKNIRTYEFDEPTKPNPPRNSLGQFRRRRRSLIDPPSVNENLWERAAEAARELALAVEHPKNFEQEQQLITDEIDRLDRYLEPRKRKQSELAEFVLTLSSDSKVTLPNEAWKALPEAISNRAIAAINEALRSMFDD